LFGRGVLWSALRVFEVLTGCRTISNLDGPSNVDSAILIEVQTSEDLMIRKPKGEL
jgi:hypothetical protein